jgi:hypothetical protein
MNSIINTLATAVAATVFSANAFAQNAQDLRGRTPFIQVGKEPPGSIHRGSPISPGIGRGHRSF